MILGERGGFDKTDRQTDKDGFMKGGKVGESLDLVYYFCELELE